MNNRNGSNRLKVFEEGYGKEIDIWGIGRLIIDASRWIIGLSYKIL